VFDPLQARYSGLPSPPALETMTAAKIGRAILPTLAKRLSLSTSGFVPRDFARGSA
jgi:hypothetical protein